MTAGESMRGEMGTHGSKRRRMDMDRREEWEMGQDEYASEPSKAPRRT